MDRKYIERYHSFCSSLESLMGARDRDLNDEFVLSGTVQKFSLTFDIAWKVMKDIIVKYHKINDFATGSPRETLRIAYSVKLIGDDRWMNMLGDRNGLTHDYDGTMAKEKVHVIVDEYIPLFVKFREVAGKFC
ncbi:MAG: toxin-antitoxin system antitoxin subunit [Lachnospiraceae bacterium]|nr:toxin-antitoxin system antitoxin subunit [Lachnospiraceae bacterium]